MTDNIHPYKCPACETAIRATNYEAYHAEDNAVIKSPFGLFSEYEYADGEQLHYCPNADCRVVRLFPGESEDGENTP